MPGIQIGDVLSICGAHDYYGSRIPAYKFVVIAVDRIQESLGYSFVAMGPSWASFCWVSGYSDGTFTKVTRAVRVRSEELKFFEAEESALGDHAERVIGETR